MFKERDNRFLRIFDRYLGIPLVVTLGLFKQRRRKPVSITKIALLKTAAMGDTVLLSAVIRDIKEEIANSVITLFVGYNNYEIAKILAEAFHDINVIKLPINNPFKAISVIKQHKFDVWLDFGPWPRINALFSFFANADFKAGFKTKGQYRHYSYDAYVVHSNEVHEVYNYKNLVKLIGINGNNLPLLPLNWSGEEEDKWVVIHIFPGGYRKHLKEWPQDRWIKLINYLTDKEYLVFLTGAKGDRSKALDILSMCKNKEKITVVAGEASLKEVILLLRKSSLAISVNTGVMHLASALGCNLIALHGPTSSKRWGPLNKNSISIQSHLPCSPCLNLGFEYGCSENKCMQAISVDTVISAVESFISDK